MLNPTVNQAVAMKRIAKKIEAAASRMERWPATGTQAVLRCNGRVQSETIMTAKKEYVN